MSKFLYEDNVIHLKTYRVYKSLRKDLVRDYKNKLLTLSSSDLRRERDRLDEVIIRAGAFPNMIILIKDELFNEVWNEKPKVG